MKMTSIYMRSALVLGLAWSMTACDDGLTEVNEDPNAPTDVPAQFLLPQAIRAGVEMTFDQWMQLSHSGVFAQHVSEIQYADEERGNVRPSNMDAFWANYYVGPLQDIQLVVLKGRETEQPNHEGVGLIWRSWLFHQVTDLWGDVPYTQALSGADASTPEYDTQQAIYNGVLDDLTAGQAMLTSAGVDFGNGDILYNNDMAKWRKFANSLRMRLAMRMVNADPATAQSEFVAAYNAGGFTSNADNAMLTWPGAPYENPLYENYLGRDDHGVSRTLIDTLAALNDPRVELYAEPAALDGAFRGNPNGYAAPPDPNGLGLGQWSRIGNFWRADGAATPTAIMTYAEVLFLQAEAAQRGWIGASAADLYHAAIRASMNQYDAWGSPADAPTDAEIDAYLAQPEVAYDASRGLEQIHLQLWLALYMNGNEAWSHVRRTGTPDLQAGPDYVHSRLPTRYIYPDTEQSLNSASLNAALSRQGGGLDLITPMWWMQ